MADRERRSASRRRFFQMAVAGAAAAAGCRPTAVETVEVAPPALKPAKKRVPVAVQLYSVRGECGKDLPGTLSQIAEMGYEGVEFAGYYGRDATALRKLLDERGLKCAGTHTGLNTLLGDELQKTIDLHKTLGAKFLIVPGLPGDRRNSAKAWLETAGLFNEIAAKLKPHGMRTGYHNHSHEFKPMDGKLPWDIFFGNTVPEVVMQVDTGNAMHGGGDAVALLKRYPGRAGTLHVKPFSRSNPKAVVGEDELPWNEIFTLCEATGGTEWYIVEYEVGGVPAVDAIKRCLEGMRKLGR